MTPAIFEKRRFKVIIRDSKIWFLLTECDVNQNIQSERSSFETTPRNRK